MQADIVDKAADFVARAYSGEATVADRQVLKQWLAENPDHEKEYRRVLDTWHFMGELGDHAGELGSSRRAGVRRWAVAAGLMLAVGIGFLLGNIDALLDIKSADRSVAVMRHQTDIGEQQTVTLADGSAITLNTNTRILVDFDSHTRRTVLERGEAFFDIAPDASRPFIVDTGMRAVTVLGTKFDLLKTGFDLQVAVVEGIVAVHSSHQRLTANAEAVEFTPDRLDIPQKPVSEYRLSAGVIASFSGSPGSSGQSVETGALENTDRYPNWRYGTLRFKNRPLSDVVADLNRYIRKEIRVESSTAMQLKVTGIFQLATVEDDLHKIEKVLPVKVTRYPEKIVISDK